jgi:protein O-mannosyl-transferase
MMPPLKEGPFRGLIVGMLCLAAFAAYWNTFQGEFVWDDASSVLLHKNVQDPAKLTQLFREDQHAFGRGQGNFYRPLVSVSFMIDYALSDVRPPPEGEASPVPDVSPFLFHLTNILWHAATAILLFALLTRLDAPRFVRAAVPLLYVVHPLHTEAVAYISGRADMMAAAFMFGALFCALWSGTPARRIAGISLCAVTFALGLLSKESAFILPALLALFVTVVPRRSTEDGDEPAYPRPVVPLAVTAALLGAYGLLRFTVLSFGSGDAAQTAAPFGTRLLESGQAFALYMRLMFAPTGLHMERSLADAPAWLGGAGALLLAASLGLVALCLFVGQRRAALGMAWFLITWFPISGIFPLNAPMAEHWLYVPMAGFIWALAELLWWGLGKTRARHAATAAVCVAALCLIALTAARNRDWHDNESLFKATLAHNPDTARVHFNLAVTYDDILDKPTAARRHYEKVIRIYEERRQESPELAGTVWTDELESRLSLGEYFMKANRFDKAIEQFAPVVESAATEANRDARAWAFYGLGQSLLAVGQAEPAQKMFQGAVGLIPELKPQVDALLRDRGLAPTS